MQSIKPQAALARFQLLKAMDTVIQSLECDDAAFLWAAYIPPSADDDDLMEVAANAQDFDKACRLFSACIRKGGENGFIPFFDDEGQVLFGAEMLTEEEWEQERNRAQVHFLMQKRGKL